MVEGQGRSAKRRYEHPPNVISFYSDQIVLVGTEGEFTLQVYETIPDPPDAEGNVMTVTTRLRASVTISLSHASKLADVLKRNLEQHPATAPGSHTTEDA